jgi:cephalosporin hydroxylase
VIDIVASIGETVMLQNALPEALKTEVDLKRYETILADVAPAVVVELGTFRGASALWFAEVGGCEVITVDICPLIHYDMLCRWAGRVRHLIGPSTDPNLVAHVAELIGSRGPVMVVADSDHSAVHVAAELDAYSPMVTPGSYFICEDGIIRWAPWFGYEGSPLDAAEAFLAAHPGEWTNDEEVEGMFPTSQHPGGWLRRLK